MEPTEKFTGEFRLVEGPSSDQKAAVPDQITLSSPPNAKQAKATFVSCEVLLGEALFSFGEGQCCTPLVLAQKFEITRSVFLVGQPQSVVPSRSENDIGR